MNNELLMKKILYILYKRDYEIIKTLNFEQKIPYKCLTLELFDKTFDIIVSFSSFNLPNLKIISQKLVTEIMPVRMVTLSKEDNLFAKYDSTDPYIHIAIWASRQKNLFASLKLPQ